MHISVVPPSTPQPLWLLAHSHPLVASSVCIATMVCKPPNTADCHHCHPHPPLPALWNSKCFPSSHTSSSTTTCMPALPFVLQPHVVAEISHSCGLLHPHIVVVKCALHFVILCRQHIKHRTLCACTPKMCHTDLLKWDPLQVSIFVPPPTNEIPRLCCPTHNVRMGHTWCPFSTLHKPPCVPSLLFHASSSFLAEYLVDHVTVVALGAGGVT